MELPKDIETRLCENLAKMNEWLNHKKINPKEDYDAWYEHELKLGELYRIEKTIVQEWADRDPAPEILEYQQKLAENREIMLSMQSAAMRMMRVYKDDPKAALQAGAVVRGQNDKLMSNIAKLQKDQ